MTMEPDGPKRRPVAQAKCPICKKRLAATSLESHILAEHGAKSLDRLKLVQIRQRENQKRVLKQKRSNNKGSKKKGNRSKAERLLRSAELIIKRRKNRKKKSVEKRGRPRRTDMRPRRHAEPKLTSDQEKRVQNRDTPDGNPLYGDWFE